MGQHTIAIEQLVPGRLDVTDDTALFGSVLLSQIGSNLPVLIRISSRPGWTSYVLSSNGDCIYGSGIRCAPENCLVAGGDADLALICHAPADVIVCRIGERPGNSTACRGGTYRVAGNAAKLARLRAAISSLQGPLMQCLPMSQATLRYNAMCADLRDSLDELSSCDISESSRGSYRTMSIERGRRYIHANFSGAMRIASVCEAAGIRSRTLEYGFRKLFGIAPVTYIKALRLNHVRRLLLDPASARRTITAIALDSGFWHLSQFAADYQKFFGESPSITRRRSRATAPAESVPGRHHGMDRVDQRVAVQRFA